jgi:hypothetical protein
MPYEVLIKCPKCGRERLVRNYQLKLPTHTGLCRQCSDNINIANYNATKPSRPFRKRGIYTEKGYRRVGLPRDSFFLPMANARGWVLEHRLVMAQSLGRCLHRWELVHHKNHIRNDNRLENLQLIGEDGHLVITILETHIKYLERLLRNNDIKFTNFHPRPQ